MAKTALAVLLLALAVTAQADCRHFFRQKVVVQQQVAVPYVAPIVYAPLVFYQAGDELRIQAAVRRELEYQQQSPSKGYQSPQQAPVRAPIQAPPVKGGTLEPLQNVQVGVFAKCARCHTGAEPAGGLVLDGQTPITAHAVYRWGQIAGQSRDVPAKMAALIGAMTPDEKGRINDALLDLVAAEPRPVPTIPPPAPVPSGELQ